MKFKSLLIILSLVLPMTSAYAEDYNDQLKKLEKDMKKSAMGTDAMSSNPFQTGSALTDYFLNEQQLLLTRDNWFLAKANKLETTQDVADYHWRLGIMRSHANNMLLQLLKSLEARNKAGYVEQGSAENKKQMDDLIAECNADAACVQNKLNNPETSLQNIFTDNFALASQIFSQVPYMHMLEVNSIYQLIQLTQLEVLHGKNQLAIVEFNIFANKQRTLNEAIKRNKDLTAKERELHKAMVNNTVNKWKKRILERKFDHNQEFITKVNDLKKLNQQKAIELEQLKRDNPDLFVNEERPKCSLPPGHPLRKNFVACDNDIAISNLDARFALVRSGGAEFLGKPEIQLSKEFWKELE